MKIEITCYKDHHVGFSNPMSLEKLNKAIQIGILSDIEDEEHDEKITITIETEDEYKKD